MAKKKITDLQLISSVADDLSIPGDNGIQTYRATALQIKNYILAAGNVGETQLATDAVTTAKIKDGNVTIAKLAASLAAFLQPVGAVLTSAAPAASVPAGYLYCNGQAVSRTTYADLFNLIGIAHGQGNGTTTFNLPDYRGVFLRGVDGGRGFDPDRATRQALVTGGNTGDNVGSYQDDALLNHTHLYAKNISVNTVGGVVGFPGTNDNFTNNVQSGGVYNLASVTSTETRPRNVNVNYFIKY